jgi:hypothetical protein
MACPECVKGAKRLNKEIEQSANVFSLGSDYERDSDGCKSPTRSQTQSLESDAGRVAGSPKSDAGSVAGSHKSEAGSVVIVEGSKSGSFHLQFDQEHRSLPSDSSLKKLYRLLLMFQIHRKWRPVVLLTPTMIIPQLGSTQLLPQLFLPSSTMQKGQEFPERKLLQNPLMFPLGWV